VRAIDIVEKLLDTHGPPVYVRHEIVHNVHVVRDLEARGAVFVDSEQDVPEGALVVLSAHGVAPEVYRKCEERNLEVVDAVCPLVSKVHAEARRYAARGHKIALVGHAGHVEVEGTMGEAPASIVLVETEEDARNLEVEDGEGLAYLTQTTLSLDDTSKVVDILR
jgi:4-hydroxy-3-methylbut-2-enyl diphosphate reductase